MDELKQIKELADPNEILLVVDAMTGKMLSTLQIVLMNSLELLGLLLPKWMAILGAALSIRAVTGAPIKFVGSGEKLTDLEIFHPDRMSSRILGMGTC